MSTVELIVENSIARIHIDRADKHNALTQAMWQQIHTICEQLVHEVTPKVVIISAAGGKAFCAGADIAELTEMIKDEKRLTNNNQIVQQAQIALQNLPFPTIAAINGVCIGGGMGIALCCDFRIAVEHAKFGITPSKLGLLYSIEDTKRLVDAVGLSKAKELLYLGKIIDVDQALAWGLVNEVVMDEELESSANNLAEQLLTVSSYSVSGAKKTLAFVSQAGTDTEKEIRDLFDNAFSQADFKEGADAFLNKRKPEFK